MGVNTEKCKVVSISAACAELVGMFLFVLVGAGTAMSIPHTSGWILHVSLAFGLAITTLAYSFGHFSGGQFNCAVTWGLILAGKLGCAQGLFNTIAQLLGASLAGLLAASIIPQANDQTYGAAGPGVACNGLGANVTATNAFLGEVFFTGLLMLVVLETACSKRTAETRGFAAIPIGLAVFLAHSVMIPIDGCSINPTRSFGTAVAAARASPANSPFDNFWVFVFGPLLGATLAVGVFNALRKCGPPESSAWMTDDKEAIQQELDDEEEYME